MARKRKKKRSDKTDTRTTERVAVQQPRNATCRIYLMLAAFCSGASVMIVELAGNRVLAPIFGNSLYTWTGLIGVILMSISCGYYLGGYLADKRPDYVYLAHLLAFSAAFTMAAPLFWSGIGNSAGGLGAVWGPMIVTALLFALPGLLLASVSPFAVRMLSLLWRDKSIGVSAGLVGMLSTLGSVSGTFGAGFVLVPHLGVKAIFLGAGGTIAVLAVIGYMLFSPAIRQKKALVLFPITAFGVLGAAAYFSEEETPRNVLFDQTTFYHRVQVTEQSIPSSVTGEEPYRLRTLYLDTTEEGSQFVNSRQLPMEYQRYWELAPLFCPQLKDTVFLGGGAFTMPQAPLDACHDAHADVVEIDPVVIEVGRKYFRVDADEYKGRLNVVEGDARRFLRLSQTTYDVIFADAYHGKRNIPAHLVTVEFFELARNRLNDRGVLIVNIGSTFAGEGAVMFQSVAKTVAQVFRYQCVFATQPGNPREQQNVFIVAACHDLDAQSLFSGQYDEDTPTARLRDGYLGPSQYDTAAGVVFTDDYNPVEYLVAGTL